MAAQGAFGTDFYDRSILRPNHRAYYRSGRPVIKIGPKPKGALIRPIHSAACLGQSIVIYNIIRFSIKLDGGKLSPFYCAMIYLQNQIQHIKIKLLSLITFLQLSIQIQICTEKLYSLSYLGSYAESDNSYQWMSPLSTLITHLALNKNHNYNNLIPFWKVFGNGF